MAWDGMGARHGCCPASARHLLLQSPPVRLGDLPAPCALQLILLYLPGRTVNLSHTGFHFAASPAGWQQRSDSSHVVSCSLSQSPHAGAAAQPAGWQQVACHCSLHTTASMQSYCFPMQAGEELAAEASHDSASLWTEAGRLAPQGGSPLHIGSGGHNAVPLFQPSPPATLEEAMQRQRRLLHGAEGRRFWQVPKVRVGVGNRAQRGRAPGGTPKVWCLAVQGHNGAAHSPAQRHNCPLTVLFAHACM